MAKTVESRGRIDCVTCKTPIARGEAVLARRERPNQRALYWCPHCAPDTADTSGSGERIIRSTRGLG